MLHEYNSPQSYKFQAVNPVNQNMHKNDIRYTSFNLIYPPDTAAYYEAFQNKYALK